MSFLQIEQGRLTRLHIEDVKNRAVSGGEKVSTMLDYLDGGAHPQILKKMALRYCRRIERDPDWQSDGAEPQNNGLYFANPILSAQAAVEAGLFEITTIDAYQKITRYVANLTQDTSYKYYDESGNEWDGSEDIEQAREDGGFNLKLARCDEISVATGCCGFMPQQLGSSMDYQPIQSNRLWVVHADEIIDESIDGENKRRPTNKLNIEEATVVVIELGSIGNGKFEFLAIYPRSNMNERGRHVKYTASKWSDIPDVGIVGASEHYNKAGEIDNPLTTLQETNQNWEAPEIPIVIWYGVPVGVGSKLLPTMDALYETCLELDLGNSRALTTANKSATGVTVISSELGANTIMPDNLGEGMNQLGSGNAMNIISIPGANVETLQRVVETQAAFLAEAYGMPSHMVKVSDGNMVHSGTALVQMTQVANRMRMKRAEINRTAMARIFEIEKGIAAISRDEADYGIGIRQEWEVEPMTYVKTDMERFEEAAFKQNQLKIAGQREHVKAFVPGIETDEQVDTFVEELKLPVAPAPNKLQALLPRGNNAAE
jgi:hypothetical protein